MQSDIPKWQKDGRDSGLCLVAGSRALAPRGGNDRVNTPDYLAAQIVAHFVPTGKILEPCRGGGAFTRAIPGCEWCEIDDGRDFFCWNQPVDWVVTNPPWSKFRAFLRHSMEIANNVVFLSLLNAFFMRARVEDMRNSGFGIMQILMLPTPPKPWPQAGFQLAATHIKRGWRGPAEFVYANNRSPTKPMT